jgi:hypothetical protein
MSNYDKIERFFDLSIDMFKELEKVPKWRLVIAFILLGEKFNKSLLKLKEI